MVYQTAVRPMSFYGCKIWLVSAKDENVWKNIDEDGTAGNGCEPTRTSEK